MSLLRGSSGSEAARLIKQLSDLLALVLVGAEKSTREAKRQLGQTFDPLSPFQNEHYLPQIPDYENWVPYPQWISLDKINKRLKGKGDCFYLYAKDLINDLHQLYLNAERYNTPGNGQIGNTDLADTARRLLDNVCEGLTAHDDAINNLEEQIDVAVLQSPSPLSKPCWAERPLQSRPGTWRIPEHSEAFLLAPSTPLPPDVFRLLFFTKGKPDGMPCLGVRCPKHPHTCMERGHLQLLDRNQDVMRWFGAHGSCRPEWQEFTPDFGKGEGQNAYRQRVGPVLHFSKHAPSSRQIAYPRHFAAAGQEMVAAAAAAAPAVAPAGPASPAVSFSETPFGQDRDVTDTEGSPPTFLEPHPAQHEWPSNSLSPQTWSAQAPASPQLTPPGGLKHETTPASEYLLHPPAGGSDASQPAPVPLAPQPLLLLDPRPHPLAPPAEPMLTASHMQPLQGSAPALPQGGNQHGQQTQHARAHEAYAAKRPRLSAPADGPLRSDWRAMITQGLRCVPLAEHQQAYAFTTELMGRWIGPNQTTSTDSESASEH